MRKTLCILLSLLLACTIFCIPCLSFADKIDETPAGVVINTAKEEVGYVKDGTDKYTLAARKLNYGAGAGWCGRFVWWCFYTSGNKEAYYGGKFSGNPTKLRDWAVKNDKVISKEKARPGDIFIIIPKSGTHHTGLIEYVDSNGKIHTIERYHTSKKPDGVYRVTRKSVGYIVRPEYEKIPGNTMDTSCKGTATASVNYRTGPSTSFTKVGSLKKGEAVTVEYTVNGWGKLSNGYFVSMSYIKYDGSSTSTVTKPSTSTSSSSTATKPSTSTSTKPSTATSTTSSSVYPAQLTSELNYRTGPGTKYSKKGKLKKGTVVTVVSTTSDWVKMSDGYYISKKYTKLVTGSFRALTIANVKYRTGPGTGYSSKGICEKGTTVKISFVKNGWAKLSNGLYISLKYTK